MTNISALDNRATEMAANGDSRFGCTSMLGPIIGSSSVYAYSEIYMLFEFGLSINRSVELLKDKLSVRRLKMPLHEM